MDINAGVNASANARANASADASANADVNVNINVNPDNKNEGGGYNAGHYVISTAGHDRGNVYIIIKNDSRYIYVSDGRTRTLDNLKAKNIRHVQLVKRVDNIVEEKLSNGGMLTDEDIRAAIKRYESTDVNC